MKNVYVVVLNAIPFLPYVHGLLRAHAEEDPEVAAGYRFREPLFLLKPTRELVEDFADPAVVGFSCYVWNFRKQMKLARLVKERHPEALLVAGGPHVPNGVGSFFDEHPYIDLLVHGEGEVPFRKVLRENLEPRPGWGNIPGLSFRRDGRVVSTGPGEMLPRDIAVRSPYLAGYMDGAIQACRERDLAFYALWETNRGCPYSCSFCDWGSATMSKVRRFDGDRLLAEVDFFGRERVPNVFICDANFGILPRDVEIAEGLTRSRRELGYPRQIRVNFAKNSNDRVFRISQVFHDHDMLMGTTLSMQSTSMEVLEAIDRENIGLAAFRALKERYAEAGIHTYTELILGLPLETRESFLQGIGSLLEAGNHDDIRVFEFTILPNAPINQPATLERYGLDLVEKRMHLEAPGTPDDEVETTLMVAGSRTLSREEWIECSLFAQAIQFLHNGCFTRYLSIHLWRQYGLRYADFYERLLHHALERPGTVLGHALGRLEKLYRDYLENPAIPQINLIASQPDMIERLLPFGHRKGWTADNWGWLCLAAEHHRFYTELREFIASLNLPLGPEMDDVLCFQSDIMLQLDYDPAQGKRVRYGYDLPSYFTSAASLERRPVTIFFRDTHMGVNRQYPLVPHDPRRFAKAAIGVSYPFVRVRHYQHQWDAAEIEYHESTDFRVQRGNHAVYGTATANL